MKENYVLDNRGDFNFKIQRYIGGDDTMYFKNVCPIMAQKNAQVQRHHFEVLNNEVEYKGWQNATLNEFWISLKYRRYHELELENLQYILDRHDDMKCLNLLDLFLYIIDKGINKHKVKILKKLLQNYFQRRFGENYTQK